MKNLYAELGSLARLMIKDPARYAVLIGTLLVGFGGSYCGMLVTVGVRRLAAVG